MTVAQLNRENLWGLEILSVSNLVMGVLCALLGAVGVFGAIAQMVARRMQEIGIRMAIGATRRAILMLVLRRSLILAAVAVVIGVPVAVAVVHLMGNLQALGFPLITIDLATLAAVAILVFGTVLAASYAPAQWATRVDPTAMLRYE
jgi:ABC-type antimicrobial peptide transport system permease subunit